MQDIIGTTAGRIWKHLEQNGTLTPIELKAALGIPNSTMYLALGWLAREGKIEITASGHSFRISLKDL
ncbi:MAG: winged helix-turn-helix domain-containing protein [Endomicrobiales bacterium]|nr:winged helix-turn-helix domain-containing protein [Endomicrobiales bacterium]